MLLAIFVDNFLIQLLVFIIVSIISLLITKPLVNKFKKNDVEPTNVDRVIGKKAEVIKKITPDEYREVKVLGSIWTATSDTVLNVSDKAVVKKIDGVKLVVEKEEK